MDPAEIEHKRSRLCNKLRKPLELIDASEHELAKNWCYFA